MALDSYTNLKSAIADWLDNNSLTDQIDDFIDLAEERHNDEIRIRELLTNTAITLSEDASTVALPSDFLDFKRLRIQIPSVTAGPKFYPDVRELTIEQMTEHITLTAGRPCYFNIIDNIQFDAPADQDYSGEFIYYAQPTALSDSNSSNEILAKAPSLYLFGALVESAPHIHDDERIAMWEAKYVSVRDRVNRMAQESRRGGPLISRVKGRVA